MAYSKYASVRARAIKTVAPFLLFGVLLAGCVDGASVETPLSESFVDVLERLPNSPLPPPPPPPGPDVVNTEEACDLFCTAVLANCVDDNEVYSDEETCLEACGTWTSNAEYEEGDTEDSLECRAHFAGTPAEDDPETNCPATAADGGGVCIEVEPAVPCETFCATVLEKCVDDNEVYADEAECLDACSQWPSNPDFQPGDGGDSAECRAHYAGDPLDEAPETNCPAVGADGGGICIDVEPVLPCDTYCELALANCVEDHELYADDVACQEACAQWPSDPDYEPGVGGDSVECRTYHVGTPAAEEPEIHCLHAAPDGGGVCVVPVEPGTCETDEDCLILDDGNFCNGGWTCAEGTCYEVSSSVECDQSGTSTCSERVCDPTTGGCVEVNKANGSYCNADGDSCTLEDRCQDGQCITGKRIYCDDGNPCTVDECKPGGCKYTNTSAPSCDDGNPCTVDESCSGGFCTGKSSECNCGSDEDCAPFDDGDLCNGTLECKSGKCKVKTGSPVSCANSSEGPCAVSLCNPSTGLCEASPVPEGSGCTDGDKCTIDDVCVAGECVGVALDCVDRPCHDVACENGTCSYTAQEDGADCSPGTPCTEGATCLAGGCMAPVDVCSCTEDADCAAFEDEDLCNGTLTCFSGRCVTDPASVPSCDDLDDFQCQTASCDPATGLCEPVDLDGTECDDGDVCKGPDQCLNGNCIGFSLPCEVEDGCQEGVCHPFAGCRPTAVGGLCTGDDPCALESACSAGGCLAKELLACESDNPCLAPVCIPETQECEYEPVAGSCDDGDLCTSPDYCSAGECVGLVKACDQSDPCKTGQCEPSTGECLSIQSDGGLCNDGNACTAGDRCSFGTCEGAVDYGCECVDDVDCADFGWVEGEDLTEEDSPCFGTLVCQSGTCKVQSFTCPNSEEENTPCTYFGCNALTGDCEMLPRGDGAACDDGSGCTDEDRCSAGTCQGFGGTCDDGNPCTLDSCDSDGVCANETLDGDVCDDGNTCTADTLCSAGVCTGGAENTCPCETTADCEAQEDGNACNGTLVCGEGGFCEVDLATVVTCDDQETQCALSTCNPATGACETTDLEGVPCQDGDLCTIGDVCEAGACVGGEALECVDDSNSCRVGTCDPLFGGCTWENVDGACDDFNPCTTDDSCKGGECLGTTNVCSCDSDEQCRNLLPDLCLGDVICGLGGCELVAGTAIDCSADGDTPCAFQECDGATGGCALVVLEAGSLCDDGDACTVGTLCDDASACVGEPTVCDDVNECTEDSCDPAVGCQYTAIGDGNACDDYDECTSISICQQGQCNGLANTCTCQSAAQCPVPTNAQGEMDYCTGEYACTQGKCVKGSAVTCSESADICAPQVCQPNTGICEKVPQEEGTICDDGDPCTDDDVCKSHPILGGFCKGTDKFCGDGNPCTQDSCISGNCVYGPLDEVFCDDGDPCTKLEECSNGVCEGGSYVCLCTDFDDPGQCTQLHDDGDLCNGVWRCVDVGDISPTGKGCLPDPTSVVDCSDDDPSDCVYPECTPGTGLCIFPTGAEGSACDDGSVCTVQDTCQESGDCTGIHTVTCFDPNPEDCLDIACHPILGSCEPTARGDHYPCDDANQCTTSDRCISGGCQGDLIDCDDEQVCTDDACSAELGCVNTELFGSCDDGDPCTANDACKYGICEGGDDLPCTCTNDADCFDDGDQCNGIWTCQNFSCNPVDGSEVVCDEPENPCLEVACDTGTGDCIESTRQDGYPCDDEDPCTSEDQCVAGVCGGSTKCDDGNTCTDSQCNPDSGACSHALITDGTACDDGDPCTDGDICQAATCISGAQDVCPCTTTADCGAFEDDDLCNGTLVCREGSCQVNPLSVITCATDAAGCNDVICNVSSGACEAYVILDGTSCNDGDPCTADDQCGDGSCAGTPVGCDDGDPCTHDLCDPDVGCVHHLAVGPCDDGDPCTHSDSCSDGNCIGKIDNCNDDEPCTKDECVAGVGCRNLAKPNGQQCNDGNICTDGDQCNGGTCVGVNLCACEDNDGCVEHDDNNVCNGILICQGNVQCVPKVDSVLDCGASTDCLNVYCDNEDGCVEEPINAGGACDDGDVCTENGVCVGGQCVGTAVDCSEVAPGICSAGVCLEGVGCQPEDIIGSCESDGNDCTVADRCVAGVCQGIPAVPPADGFESGELSAWELSSTGAEASWDLTGTFSYAGTQALHAANASTGNMIDGAGAWSATARGTGVAIPEGAIFAEVRFQLRMDVTDQTCSGDVLHVQVNDVTVDTHCADTDGFVQVGADISGEIGETVTVGFVVDSAAGGDNGDVGVTIDDVTFDWSCPIQ